MSKTCRSLRQLTGTKPTLDQDANPIDDVLDVRQDLAGDELGAIAPTSIARANPSSAPPPARWRPLASPKPINPQRTHATAVTLSARVAVLADKLPVPDKELAMNATNKARGHYCWACQTWRANERFSGKGHKKHVCKKCQKLDKAELEFRQERLNIERMLDRGHGRIPRKCHRQFEMLLAHPNPRIRQYALDIRMMIWGMRDRYRDENSVELWSPSGRDDCRAARHAYECIELGEEEELFITEAMERQLDMEAALEPLEDPCPNPTSELCF